MLEQQVAAARGILWAAGNDLDKAKENLAQVEKLHRSQCCSDDDMNTPSGYERIFTTIAKGMLGHKVEVYARHVDDSLMVACLYGDEVIFRNHFVLKDWNQARMLEQFSDCCQSAESEFHQETHLD